LVAERDPLPQAFQVSLFTMEKHTHQWRETLSLLTIQHSNQFQFFSICFLFSSTTMQIGMQMQLFKASIFVNKMHFFFNLFFIFSLFFISPFSLFDSWFVGFVWIIIEGVMRLRDFLFLTSVCLLLCCWNWNTFLCDLLYCW
jgi:hypothetical protein